MSTSITIHDISTRELRDALRGGDFFTVENVDAIFVATRVTPGGPVSVYATVDEIKAVLATRPHLNSKREGKLIRRLMATTGQSEQWLRAHPTYGKMIGDASHPHRRPIPKEEYVRLKRVLGKYVDEQYVIGS